MSKIKLSPKEQLEYFELPNEIEQKKFLDNARERRTKLMLKTAVLSSILVTDLDELNNYGLMKLKLKQIGNNFTKELDKYIDDIYKDNADPMGSTNYIMEVSSEIEKLL